MNTIRDMLLMCLIAFPVGFVAAIFYACVVCGVEWICIQLNKRIGH